MLGYRHADLPCSAASTALCAGCNVCRMSDSITPPLLQQTGIACSVSCLVAKLCLSLWLFAHQTGWHLIRRMLAGPSSRALLRKRMNSS